MKKNKFKLPATGLSEKERNKLIAKAAKQYEKFMDVLLPGWEDDPNSVDTPNRVAKAFVEDIAKGLYFPFPKMTAFDNVDMYDSLVVQANIPIKSFCAHHHQAISGIAHIAYVPAEEGRGKVIGLSKLNRIADYYSRTPQVQENLTKQIHDGVSEVCEGNGGVAVIIIAKHNCVGHRGVNQDSDMVTSKLSGGFETDGKIRAELYKLIEFASVKSK